MWQLKHLQTGAIDKPDQRKVHNQTMPVWEDWYFGLYDRHPHQFLNAAFMESGGRINCFLGGCWMTCTSFLPGLNY